MPENYSSSFFGHSLKRWLLYFSSFVSNDVSTPSCVCTLLNLMSDYGYSRHLILDLEHVICTAVYGIKYLTFWSASSCASIRTWPESIFFLILSLSFIIVLLVFISFHTISWYIYRYNTHHDGLHSIAKNVHLRTHLFRAEKELVSTSTFRPKFIKPKVMILIAVNPNLKQADWMRFSITAFRLDSTRSNGFRRYRFRSYGSAPLCRTYLIDSDSISRLIVTVKRMVLRSQVPIYSMIALRPTELLLSPLIVDKFIKAARKSSWKVSINSIS